MWSKYVTRRLAVQVAQAWNFGWGKAMEKIYGISVQNTLIFRDQKKTDYYVDEKQHIKYVAGLYKLFNKPSFIKNFHKDSQQKLELILKETKKKFRKNLNQLSNKELLNIYKNFILPNAEQFYIGMWTVFNIGEPLANIVRKNLEKKFKNEKEVDEYLLNLSSPLKPNDVLNERIDILQLAVYKKKLSHYEFKKRLIKHINKYQHIPMFDFDHDPYDKKYFLNELADIKNPQKELNEIRYLFIGRKREFNRTIKELQPNEKFKNLLNFLKENVFLRDYRDMIRQKLNLELRKFYNEVAHRLDLNIQQVATLTNDEIIKYLQSGQRISNKIISRRKRAYLLIQKGSKVKIYSGREALNKSMGELRIKKVKRVKEIRGVIGSAGKAKGKVKIVYTNKELNKVKQGDVMVATMTRQDFVPVMRKAAAIVTDEGSVTAHAAIIARELKIPCIVSTKIATKVLKDGDMVEVDANNGIIKILNK